MSSQIRQSARQLISRITVIWHSVLSWMHWHRRSQQRQREMLKVALLEERVRAYHDLEWKLALQEVKFRQLLLEALTPVAAAMARQDNLHQIRQDHLLDLLTEVLTSLQPSPDLLISRELGLRPLSPSSRNSGS